jgi:hypothetical protein
MPFPDSVTLNGVAVALVAMLIFADLLNVVVGLKVTPIVQEAPAARVAPQLLLLKKYVAPVPVRVMLLIESAVTPLFVRVALSIPLVVPTGTPLNLRLVGLTDAAGVTVKSFVLVMLLAVPSIIAVAILGGYECGDRARAPLPNVRVRRLQTFALTRFSIDSRKAQP